MPLTYNVSGLALACYVSIITAKHESGILPLAFTD
jgi:hypothetical protein